MLGAALVMLSAAKNLASRGARPFDFAQGDVPPLVILSAELVMLSAAKNLA